MCGIAGFWQTSRSSRTHHEGNEILKRMTSAIAHRGPDEDGAWFAPELGVGLGHRRLSIIDLSAAGSQPMTSASGALVLVFNGEIYNHVQMRERLGAEGKAPQWRGHSDTETLLAAVEAWGLDEALRVCVGMFAIAIWDQRSRTLSLARDRLGEKPLYYGWIGQQRQTLVFASELKAIRAFPGFEGKLDLDAVAEFFRYNFVPGTHCIYQGFSKVAPGAILEVSQGAASGVASERRYWSAPTAARAALATPFEDDDEALLALEQALKESVGLQACADVPLGAFLSGGVDSSTIVALMQSQSAQRVKTFTVGFDIAGFDESPHARAVAAHLGTDHHELRVNSRDALDVVALLPDMYDEPFADSSQIPTYLVCKAARSQVKVALSGDGGDELFCGYNRHLWWPGIRRRFMRAPSLALKAASAVVAATPAPALDALAMLHPRSRAMAHFGDKAHKLARRLPAIHDLRELYESLMTEWPDESALVRGGRAARRLDIDPFEDVSEAEQRMMLWDATSYLPDDILTKVDRAAMATSLETRVPFLDHRVVELAWRMPLRLKLRDGRSKWALRHILYKHVPRELIERPKAGFAIPVGQWLRGPLRDWAEALLDPKRIEAEGVLNAAPITAAWAQHLSGRHDWTPRLWSVLMFQSWLEAHR